MIRSLSALTGVLVLSSAPALAQVAPLPAAPVLLNTETTTILRAGTAVPLKMSEALTTKGKKLRVGQRFQLEVAEAVRLNDQIVIPAGSPATGEVTDVRNKGMWGKSGHINARVLFVRVNGRQIRLTGQLDDKGVTGTAGVVGALVAVPIAGFFVTGTSAVIPVGAPVKAFMDEDVPVAFAEGPAPAPMVVPTSIAPASVTPVTQSVATRVPSSPSAAEK